MLLSISTPVWRRYGNLFLVVSSSARLLLLLHGEVRFTGTGGYGYSTSLRSPTGSSWSLQSPLVPPGIEGMAMADGRWCAVCAFPVQQTWSLQSLYSYGPWSCRPQQLETPLPEKTQGRTMDRSLSV